MESHSSLRLLLLLFCLAFSIGGARPLLAPGASPTEEPDESSQLAPDAEPVAPSRLAPDVSPAAMPFPSEDFSFQGIGQLVVSDSPAESVAMNNAAALLAELDGPSANDAVDEAATFITELDVSLPPAESVGNELSPAASAAMNEAAVLVAELNGPSANELVDGVDVSAALDSLEEKTSKTLPIIGD